jgi:hypothetical protein
MSLVLLCMTPTKPVFLYGHQSTLQGVFKSSFVLPSILIGNSHLWIVFVFSIGSEYVCMYNWHNGANSTEMSEEEVSTGNCKVPVSNHGRNIDYRNIFFWFSSVPLEKCWDSTLIRLRPLPSSSFPINHLLSFYHSTLHSPKVHWNTVLWISRPFTLSVCLSVCLSTYLSTSLSIYLSIYLSIHGYTALCWALSAFSVSW